MVEKISGIYKIVNLQNGKIYIGQSVDINARWSTHRSELKRNKHGNRFLQRSWNKYGEQSFEFSVIERDNQENLNERETYWCNFFKETLGENKVYNLGHTGEISTMSETQRHLISNSKKEFYKNHPEALKQMSIERSGKKNPMYGVSGEKHPRFGKTHTEEVRKILSEKAKGRKMSVQSSIKKREKMLGEKNPMYGKNHSEETKEKIRKLSLGRKVSEQTKAKISLSSSNRIWIIKDGKSKMIQPKQLEEYLLSGWEKGRIIKKKKGEK